MNGQVNGLEDLGRLRAALIELHRLVLGSERQEYEAAFGAIPSPNHFLKLLTSDPWFAWIQPLSGLIVRLDEALDARVSATPGEIAALQTATRHLLVAREEGDGFPRHYHAALQRDPEVLWAHVEVVRTLPSPGA